MARIRRFGPCFALVLMLGANLLCAQETRTVAVLGKHPRFEFVGCQAFTPQQIHDALKWNLEYQKSLLPQTSLAAFEEQVAESVRLGYLALGYLRVSVNVQIRETPVDNPFAESDIKVVVEITEGKPYPAGRIDIQGARLADVERLRRELQPPADEVTPPKGEAKTPAANTPAADEKAKPRSVTTAKPAKKEIDWEAGEVLMLTPYALEKLERRAKVLLQQQGFMWPRLTVKTEPDDATQAAVLKIHIDDEGPRATVGKIAVTGQKRNSAEAIIKYLELPEGSPLNSDILNVAWWKLYRSARFLTYKLDLDYDKAPPGGVVPLTLSVKESEYAPLLGEKFTEEQEVLLKFGRWQERWSTFQTPFRLNMTGCRVDQLLKWFKPDIQGALLDVEFVLMPESGMYCSCTLRLPDEPNSPRVVRLLIDAEQIDGVFLTQRQRIKLTNPISLPGSTARLKFKHHIGPTIAPRTAESDLELLGIEFGFGLDSRRQPGGSSFHFDAKVAPVSMIELPFEKESSCQFQNAELVVNLNGDTARIDRQTGQLNSIKFKELKDYGGSLEIQPEPDALRRIRHTLDNESRDFPAAAGSPPSLVSAVGLLWYLIDIRHPATITESRQFALQCFDSVLQDAITDLPVANRLFPGGEAPAFYIPYKDYQFETTTLKDVAGFLKIRLLDLNTLVFPESSGMSDMSRFAAVWMSREKPDWLSSGETHFASEFGPLANLYGSVLLYGVNPNASFQLANNGQRTWRDSLIRAEIDSLIQNDAVLGKAILSLAKRIKNFSADDLSRLTGQLNLQDHQPLLEDIRRKLSQADDEQLRATTVDAIFQLWDPLIESPVKSALAFLASPRSSDVAPSETRAKSPETAGRNLTIAVKESGDVNGPIVVREDEDQIVATVNGEPIFAREILFPFHARLIQIESKMREEFGSAFKPELVDGMRSKLITDALPRVIEYKVLAQAARKNFNKRQLEGLMKAVEGDWTRHLQEMIQSNGVNSLDELKEKMGEKHYDLELHRATFIENNIAQNFIGFKVHATSPPTREELLAYYESHRDEYRIHPRVRWQQLVVSFDATNGPAEARLLANKLAEELKGGGDFTAIIMKHGDGPKAQAGGVWDWTKPGGLLSQDVDKALFVLPVGGTSGVIETETSFQIVKVLERIEAEDPAFEKVEQQVKDALTAAIRHKKGLDIIKELRDAAKIEITVDAKTKAPEKVPNE